MKHLFLSIATQIAQNWDPWKRGNIWSDPQAHFSFLPGELSEAPAEITRTQKAVVPLGKEKSGRYLGLLKGLELSLDLSL